MKIIVYCGASIGNSPEFEENAIEIGEWIAHNGHSLVYGGGNVGLMGTLANTVLENGGEVIGVMPKFLADREIAHPNLTELIIAENMSERKNKILSNGDVCLALPGGPGTLEEIAEVISWSRIGQNDRPCILYNRSGYYDLLSGFFDNMVSSGFLSDVDRKNICFAKSINEIQGFIENFKPLDIRKY
ncbi:TIGR00730 family Rossman fold protein [Macrococcus hajekii]|uniref:Cytokinin riboside 5'-monophosphate phosphoribohydrolase n=1 Tax=Macrococcus hajekii TaxID=198482 RepID=A0A4R6BLT1_9STAP|nr:TIGR00730 family Rossman fold protein [Macrococcus hajekii]TDM02746.1 TIGR00730 family Rossman fold protein [Macrococcus hajekii]GGB03534.1 cytokinin riboside 5'-monophosphate phosphoribohydrolase [Macrococcus hajekii]